MPVPPHVGVVFFSPLGVSTPHTHRCTVYIIKTMRWDQKRDRYEEGNKKNTQGLEALPACDTDSHIFQVLSHRCLRTSLKSMWASSPICRWGLGQALRDTRIHPGWRTGRKWGVRLDPGLSPQCCTQTLPGSCVEGCVERLCETRGCGDEG